MGDAARHDAWTAGRSYEAYMGRWSRLVAAAFLARLAAPAGADWVELGCGTGALTAAVLAGAAPRSILAVDPSEAFLAEARARIDDPRARFERGEAQPEPVETEPPRVPAEAGASGGSAQQPEAPASAGDRTRDEGGVGQPDFSSSGQCNMRSMSPADAEPEAELDPDLEPGLEPDSWLDDPRYLRWPDGSHVHRLPPPGYPEWDVSILSGAGMPYKKKTRDFVRLALGPILSIIIGLGLAFFLESMDHSVKSRAEAEEYLSAPVLATISDQDARKARAAGAG